MHIYYFKVWISTHEERSCVAPPCLVKCSVLFGWVTSSSAAFVFEKIIIMASTTKFRVKCGDSILATNLLKIGANFNVKIQKVFSVINGFNVICVTFRYRQNL